MQQDCPCPIVLLTDFGLEGPYVGQMKGVLVGRAPGHPVLDLNHSVHPQDVREGAFLLEVSWRYFPVGSIFVAVVDPGVGTERAAIALSAEDRFFVGPDNGLLTGALPDGSWKAVRLEDERFRLTDLSATFHGRDLFAPAGATLATGVPLEDLGTPLDSLQTLPHRNPLLSPGCIEGRVVHVDRFGNLVSNISRDLWNREIESTKSRFEIRIGSHTFHSLHHTYGEAKPGECIALFGSMGYLEIAVNRGSAAKTLRLDRGVVVEVQIESI